ncbi:Putative Calcium/proton exchanger [[Torrubiella] hemipterigena]|uniref:Putative Calcium/proton exchanger n=1 Tax=[Torrubiella] hemipterigena TaxID=1531966 RepID=A0A0A1ST95_9HYPO|nr:Putative Calcium/proton exchanger [[Torrubiella] hemipterigena]
MPTYNHYNVKRLAHSVSRSSADQTWNPFRHVSWNRKPSNRADTWDVSNAEEGRGEGARLRQFATAPNANSGRIPTEASASETIRNSNNETEEASSPAGNTDTTTRTIPATDADGVRQRKAGDASKDELPAPEEDDSKEKGKKDGLIRHVKPKMPFTIANQLQRTFLNSWINILILAAPVGIALNYVKEHNPAIKPWVVFLVNFIAIVPLAAMLSFATEEIALRTGEVIGGLLNATFGNAVELIIAIIALSNKEVQIVQTSLIGSILSNLLLVLGFCFFFGGLRRTEQYFNTTVAQTAASLLAVAVGSVIVPSVFDIVVNGKGPTPLPQQVDIAKISRGTSVILLLVYAAYLFFQLKTHTDVFNEESQKVPAKPWSMGPLSRDKEEGFSMSQGLALPGSMVSHGMANHKDEERVSGMVMNAGDAKLRDDEEDEEEEPQLHFFVALATLAISTVIIALCAEAMVGSIDELTKESGMSKEFVGLILLPIVGNAAEHATAVTVAMKDKMDLAIGVAVGSSMQVSLFLIPLLVIIGWGMNQPYMDLSFDMFQVAVLFVAVLLVNYLIGDGKSHWLEGYLLICLYAIIAVCTFWYPPPPDGDPSAPVS